MEFNQLSNGVYQILGSHKNINISGSVYFIKEKYFKYYQYNIKMIGNGKLLKINSNPNNKTIHTLKDMENHIIKNIEKEFY